MIYRREIDGLRAVAVIPVILFHAGFKTFEGGFVGVDVFFVISGYLITTIILTEMNENRFSIASFYERRARRILPALFLLMLCCLPFAWLWLLPNHLKDFSGSLVSISFFSSNVLFWRESGYFDVAAELKPLLHTWTLAVEEQFYVFFPLFLAALWKLCRRRMLEALIAATIVSLTLSQWSVYRDPSASFFLLPTRAWELTIGACIAFYLLFKQQQAELVVSYKSTSEVFGMLGLALILYSFFTFNKSIPIPSLYALVPTIGTALIIMFCTSDTATGRLLSTRFLSGIGLVSYSAYLWHQPLFVFARHRSPTEPGTGLLLALTVLSIALAYISYRFVETPFRDKRVIGRKAVFGFAVAGSFFFAAAGVTGHITNGFDKRRSDSGKTLTDISRKTDSNYGLSSDCDGSFTLSPVCRTSNEPEILVWGDSQAMHLVNGIIASNPQAKIIQMTQSACGPILDVAPVGRKLTVKTARRCQSFNKSVIDWLKSTNTVKYVVLSSSFQRQINGQLLIKDKISDASLESAEKYFISTLEQLKNMGLTPVVFSPLPQNGENIGLCLSKNEQFGNDLSVCGFDWEDKSDASKEVYKFLKNISKQYNVIFLDEAICNNGRCLANFNEIFIYMDSSHLSYGGSAFLGKKMDFYNLIKNTSKNIGI